MIAPETRSRLGRQRHVAERLNTFLDGPSDAPTTFFFQDA